MGPILVLVLAASWFNRDELLALSNMLLTVDDSFVLGVLMQFVEMPLLFWILI